jgi:hypothetical protein
MNVGRLSALLNCSIKTTADIPVTQFRQRLSRPQGLSMAARITSLEISNIIGNRIRDFPACSSVPQPTAVSRAPYYQYCAIKVLFTPVLQ